ncbi:MAG: asparagine synthase-related protein [Caldilineaceae bacterium]
MSAIFGLLRRDGAPVAPGDLATMRRALAHWGPDGGGVWLEGCTGLGQVLFCSTPESRYERLPCVDAELGSTFTAAARVDNRAGLIVDCGLRAAESVLTDSTLIWHAYRKWGAACVERIYGDWAFAVWHPVERKLFLARDHFGNTALYYYVDPRVFAFASDRQALLDLKLAPITLDELYLAQVLTSWLAYHGERTIHTPIKRLPPAHTLTVTPDRMDVCQYWFLEHTPELRLPRREDYVEVFRALVDDAVRARLRAPDPPFGYSPARSCPEPGEGSAFGGEVLGSEGSREAGSAVATTLSGGLDSSTITVTAAAMLRSEGKRLPAFTSVPLADTAAFVGKRFGDELPFAQATAQFAGNVDLQPITAAATTPIQSIRRGLQIHHEPAHAAGNQYWMLDLGQTARSAGCRVLLTGQLGNAAFSWTGSTLSQPLARQLRELGWRKWLSTRVRRALPASLYRTEQRLRRGQARDWVRKSALRPDVAARLNLWERRLDDPAARPPRSPLEERRWLMPGRSFVGALWAEMGAAWGVDVRDPTGDARLLAFSFAVPDYIFRDPATGVDRWLIRAAMEGRLPDEVRLNQRRGRQAGDLVPRLRAGTEAVETALDELARGPAAAYVDVPYMRQTWQVIQAQDTAEGFSKTVTILTRGIGAGLFVNEFLSS